MSVGNVVYNLLSQLEPLPWFTNLGMTLEKNISQMQLLIGSQLQRWLSKSEAISRFLLEMLKTVSCFFVVFVLASLLDHNCFIEILNFFFFVKAYKES